MGRIGWVMGVFAWGATVATAGSFQTRASLLSEREVVVAGDALDVGILLQMPKGWHTYWKEPGDAGLPTTVKWKLPRGFEAGPLRWPKPEVIREGTLTVNAYEDEVLLLSRIQTPSKGYPGDQPVRLEAEVEWLECGRVCVPGSATISTSFRFGERRQDASPAISALFDKYRAQIPSDEKIPSGEPVAVTPLPALPPFPVAPLRLWKMLVAALVGGLILNLMPCVLPVMAIKVLGFVRESHGRGERARSLALSYGGGVLVSFWVLAWLVAALRSGGESIGWGFQFQNPWFLMSMALVVLIVALNLFGLFEVQLPYRVIQPAVELAAHEGLAGAFFGGVLTTALATPCTAPFLAPAVGFAFSQPAPTVFLVCSAVGVGLAAPYVVLTWNPDLLKWLPKPGPWLLRFRQAMGFPMLATTLWLLWILDRSFGSEVAWRFAAWLFAAALVIGLMTVWLPRRTGWMAVVVILVAVPGYYQVSPWIAQAPSVTRTRIAPSGYEWQRFSKTSLQEGLRTPHPVFIDFTADWCLTCQVNRKSSLENSRVVRRFRELGVVALLADWTRRDRETEEALRSYHRAGVPLYVIYPSDRRQPPIILPEVLTPRMVIEALEQAAGHGSRR